MVNFKAAIELDLNVKVDPNLVLVLKVEPDLALLLVKVVGEHQSFKLP